MKRGIILLLLLILLEPCYAQRKKVGLVLGGGGAKGAAHVGVLKVLEEAEIPIDYIAGTSIGAIIGGMYSIGYSADELDSIFKSLDWMYLFSDEVDRNYKMFSAKERKDKYVLNFSYGGKQTKENPVGLISGQNLYNLFSGMTIGYHAVGSFNDLPIPFACVAVDLVSGEEVILNKGSLPMSMRASMAIPGVFEPVLLDNMVLIDGGIINTVPANVVVDMGAEIIIVVDLDTGNKNYYETKTIRGMLDQMTRLIQNCYYPKNKDDFDLYLNPDLQNFSAASFSNREIESMIQRGEDIARLNWKGLMDLKEKIYEEDCSETQCKKIEYVKRDSLEIGRITLDGISEESELWIRKRLPIKENNTVAIKDIDKAISVLYGMDIFSQIECIVGNNIPHDIHFIMKWKPYGNINVGFRFDTEELASILLNTTIKHEFLGGSVFSATARLGQNFYLMMSEQLGGIHKSKTGISYLLKYNNFSLYQGQKKFDNFSFLSHAGEIYHAGYNQNIKYMFGLHYDFFHYNEKKYVSYSENLSLNPEGFFSYFASFSFDFHDRSYYPTKGISSNLYMQLFTDNMITYKKDNPFASIFFDINGVIRLSKRYSLIYSAQSRFVSGDNIPLMYRNYMGGEIAGRYFPQQISFSGIRDIQMFDNSLLFAKLSLRYRIANNHYVSASLEYANNSTDFDFMSSRNIWGTSVKYSFNSILGPIEFQLNYSNNDKRFGMYLGVGYVF